MPEWQELLMKISPSIASSNLLHVAKEIDFVDQHFNNLHLDIEDGNAVRSISIGFKLGKMICFYSKSEEISMHLEVLHPLDFLDEIKACQADVVFIQVDCQRQPLDIIKEFQRHAIPTGINLSNLDLDRLDLPELLNSTDMVLINTTHHDDPKQICDLIMLDFALNLANQGKKVWVDGGITAEIYRQIKDSNIYAAVMGRAIFKNKEKAIEQFTV